MHSHFLLEIATKDTTKKADAMGGVFICGYVETNIREIGRMEICTGMVVFPGIMVCSLFQYDKNGI
jgi:hypothetical protein